MQYTFLSFHTYWRLSLFVVVFGPWLCLGGDDVFDIPGLEKEVEILVDRWGVSHIYADTERDLFFAQGFNVARDRLFQLEIWRRQATGTVAEWLGPSEIDRDIGARLFKFRGSMKQEMRHYHPRGAQVIESFVAGINSYIDWVADHPQFLPEEFSELALVPGHWTPEVVVSRHQGLLWNINQELNIGRMVAALGAEKVKELYWFHPHEPRIELEPGIEAEALSEDILYLYNAFRKPLSFDPDHHSFHGASSGNHHLDETEGSNNWVLAGERTSSGYPMLANDPHRTLAVPSLRYMAHLKGPGWNVVGAGEPSIPGISIGHNEYGAWGLTVYLTDAEDLYVYHTDPENPNRYRYKGKWKSMERIQETISVKGQKPRVVDLYYTRHGPVVFKDKNRNLAYAVRCGWLETGGAPYLASLRMDQATSFSEFQEACGFSNLPGENMVWADRRGNIGWQAVGIAPRRPNWSGLVPVPGDGTFEWNGFLNINQLPHVLNPLDGRIITANNHITPIDYPHTDALGYTWIDPFRGDRLAELLGGGGKLTMADLMAAQTDYRSIPAQRLVPMLVNLETEDEWVESARKRLLNWDCNLTAESVTASIYVEWERRIRKALLSLEEIPDGSFNFNLQLRTAIEWLRFPDGRFGSNPVKGRDGFLLRVLSETVEHLKTKLGPNPDDWRYGQEKNKHVAMRHAFAGAFPSELAEKTQVGPLPRGGNGYTVNNTGNLDNQSSGATFRILMDLEDWDFTLAINSPGQSGDSRSKHYQDLFPLWARDEYFPLFYSRKKIESVSERTIYLKPAQIR